MVELVWKSLQGTCTPFKCFSNFTVDFSKKKTKGLHLLVAAKVGKWVCFRCIWYVKLWNVQHFPDCSLERWALLVSSVATGSLHENWPVIWKFNRIDAFGIQHFAKFQILYYRIHNMRRAYVKIYSWNWTNESMKWLDKKWIWTAFGSSKQHFQYHP